MIVTNTDINCLIDRIVGYSIANGARSYVNVLRCIRHLNRALDSGQAARSMGLKLAQREFRALVAKIAARDGVPT